MKAEWESRDWNDTQPEERVIQLSPAEFSMIEAMRDGRTVTVHPPAIWASGKSAVVFGPPPSERETT